MKIRLFFAWFDLWIGIFIDREKRRVYLLPLPMVGLLFELAPRPVPVPPSGLLRCLRCHWVGEAEKVTENRERCPFCNQSWDFAAAKPEEFDAWEACFRRMKPTPRPPTVKVHAPRCRFNIAAVCPVAVECEHGFSVCSTCDACDCGATERRKK